ncbi:MAG: F0F1 ATP synthase subunit A [Bacilli bacterium]|nr:F0F1 ATP synthase subunit A [Bacilli bacterium]
MNERLESLFDLNPSGALISSLTIMFIIAVLAIIVGILAKRADPLKRPRGLLLVTEMFVEKMSGFVKENMGDGWEHFTGYFMALSSYLFVAFIWSITGLPSVMDNIFAPLSLAVVMWFIILFTALRYQKFGYFHRYIEPIFVFLPINIISQLTPILSTTLRMFGNAISGTIMILIVTWTLNGVSNLFFGGFMPEGLASIWLSPVPTGVLNLYFALFSGFIQTLVFISLNAAWISAERPEEAMGLQGQALRGPKE